jgi:hypothetical protein
MNAPSPFLAGTNIQLAWDSTSIGYLKTCPRLYQYIMIEGWTSKEESVHLRFGQEYHEALEDYDLSRAAGISHNDAVHDVIRGLMTRTADFDPDHGKKTRESLIRTAIWYLDEFSDDKAETLILSDGKPAVELSFRFELDWGPASGLELNIEGQTASHPYILCGHLDRVVRFSDELFVIDRKTSSMPLTSYYWVQFEPSNQMTLYSLAGKVILDSPVRGVIIDAAQIKEGETIFGRSITYRTQDQLEEWLADLRFWLTLAEQYAIEDHWPMNDTACSMYGGCRFRDICSKSPSVRERFLEGNFIKQSEEERWNPLRTR